MSGYKGTLQSRKELRYRVGLAAEVRTDWQQRCAASITDLSRHGVRLEGGRELVEKVFPNFNPPKGERRPKIELLTRIGQDIDLPAGEVSFACQTVYVRRVSSERYQIGLQFVEIGEQSLALLEAHLRWLEQHGSPAEGF